MKSLLSNYFLITRNDIFMDFRSDFSIFVGIIIRLSIRSKSGIPSILHKEVNNKLDDNPLYSIWSRSQELKLIRMSSPQLLHRYLPSSMLTSLHFHVQFLLSYSTSSSEGWQSECYPIAFSVVAVKEVELKTMLNSDNLSKIIILSE